MTVWALWRDRKLTRAEVAYLEDYAPGRSRVHACVAAIWDESDTATHLAHVTFARALAEQGWELGECEGDVWAPELAILERARAGVYAVAARAAVPTLAQYTHERSAIRRELLTHAGWCRWCAHAAFLELARAGR